MVRAMGIKNSQRGMLVAVVGIDGAGKSTQVRALTDWLEGEGVGARCLPHQTMLPVRRALDRIAVEDGLTGHLEMIGADTIRLIAACAKLTALAQIPAMLAEPGSVVLVDRYTYCQYAAVRMQKAGNEQFLRRLNRDLLEPDVTIFLDVAPETAHRRIKQRGIDEESLEFLTDLRAAYLSLPEFQSFHVVDGDGSPEQVQQGLRDVLREAVDQDATSRA
jgi:dTMP kinase